MISIIVPIFRVEQYLEECVNSIICQSYKDIEIILVDDGSDDLCPQLCDDFASRDERIKVIHKKNGGLVSARKAGAKAAKGEYIINVDSDDIIDQDLLKNISKVIEQEHPDVIGFGFEKFEDGTGITIATDVPTHNQLYTSEELPTLRGRYLYDPQAKGINGGFIPHAIWAKAVKHDLYVKCQYSVPDNVDKGEDTLFTLKLLVECNSYYMLDYIGYRYRYRKQSMINSLNPNDFQNLLGLICEMEKILDGRNYLDRQIAMYMFKRINDLSTTAVKKNISFKKFKGYIKNSEEIIDYPSLQKLDVVDGLSFKDRLLIFLIKHKAWMLIYLYKRNC